jgi:hypothetical protein
MNPIVYVPGDLADGLGRVGLIELADFLTNLTADKRPVDVLTYGPSEFHSTARFTGSPPVKYDPEEQPEF